MGRLFGGRYLINLHNVQMLFMCELNVNFQNVKPPCTSMKTPMEDFLATVLSRLADTGGHSGAVTPNRFMPLQILLCSEKNFLNI